ncbi:MAG: ribosomal RNA small subunit methyltransferase A [Anaerolineae bacterium]|nr:ribosomal RNA small subunit methyltransferase A [Anaerolineae bacterium]
MTSLRQQTRALLQQYDLEPHKGLGQHFLIDGSALARIVAAAELSPADLVVEVGAGSGTLTRALAARARRVVAIEVDGGLIALLRQELGGAANVDIVHGDLLALDLAEWVGEQPYCVVANLPYSITSAALRYFLTARRPPVRMVVTVQREVAERIVARDGRMSLLAVSVRFYGHPEILFRLRPGAFYPPPAVESTVLRIDWHARPPVPFDEAEHFFRVVRAGFSQPRKQLRNSLAGGLGMAPAAAAAAIRTAGIDPRLRAERLQLDDWARLMQVLRHGN